MSRNQMQVAAASPVPTPRDLWRATGAVRNGQRGWRHAGFAQRRAAAMLRCSECCRSGGLIVRELRRPNT